MTRKVTTPAPAAAQLSEEEFKAERAEVCAEYAASEGTRLPGSLGRAEYIVASVLVVASYLAVLIVR